MKYKGLFLILISFCCFSVFSCSIDVDYEKEQEKSIRKFLAKNSDLNFIESPTGLYYCITKEGVGPSPVKGDTVVIRYAMKFLESNLWSLNCMDVPVGISYVIGNDQLVDGVEEALTYMKAGGESVIVVPSHIGYGNYSPLYDPYTPICYQLALDDINP